MKNALLHVIPAAKLDGMSPAHRTECLRVYFGDAQRKSARNGGATVHVYVDDDDEEVIEWLRITRRAQPEAFMHPRGMWRIVIGGSV